MATLYEDERVICDDEGIIIKGYFLPIEEQKKILYSEIRTIKLQKLSLWAGLSQIWGKANAMLRGDTATKTYWSSFDLKRLFKNKAIAIDEGKLVKPVITPEEPETVYRILKAKTLELK
ncbi:hypothetical protein [Myxosarcina sp. GI1(2024)]